MQVDRYQLPLQPPPYMDTIGAEMMQVESLANE
jgi:hypothetical protein